MDDRCYIGNLRLLLDLALEDGGCKRDNDGVVLSALSKVQRSLSSSTPFSLSDEKFKMEVEDCAFSKEVGRLCMKDLETLSSNLVALLASRSNFINHAAGHTLVALSDYLHESSSPWTYVMNFIWKTLRTCFGSAEDALMNSKFLVSSLYFPAKYGYSTSRCYFAMHLFQVLHEILRMFKLEGASKLKRYLASSAVYMPEVLQAFTTCFIHLVNNPVHDRLEEEDLMLAALLRFICSFSHAMSVHSATVDAPRIIAKSQVMTSVNGFLAAFSQHCLDVQHRRCLSHYLRHKFLVLMFRLHGWFIKWPSLAITCADILKSNMVSLCPVLFQKQTQLSAPSILSPFAPCLVQKTTAQSLPFSPALQPERHAVFLIFEVESSLRKTACGNSSRSEADTASSMPMAKRQGEQWMLNWLLGHINMAGNVLSSGTPEVADCFASSFLQIFLDEDTLVLEMLLLLQDSSTSQLYSGYVDAGQQEAQKLLVEVFKPLRLFAVFLSLVSYDHSVIIDFLISKDASILCLQYLLRCLRMVRSTWPELLSLSHSSPTRHARNGSFYESKKLQANPTIHANKTNEDRPLVSDTVVDIDRVGTCLMNLKHAIERLHEKRAFPYNPSPLLKHLDSFERLWLCESNHTGGG